MTFKEFKNKMADMGLSVLYSNSLVEIKKDDITYATISNDLTKTMYLRGYLSSNLLSDKEFIKFNRICLRFVMTPIENRGVV